METQTNIYQKKSGFILFVPLIFILISGIIFNALQNASIYDATVNKFGFTYLRINNPDGTRKDIQPIKDVPFQTIDHEKLTHWDAIIYRDLANNFHQKERPDLYAFFPMFPLVWNISHLPIEAIVFFNLALFLAGYLFFYFILRDQFKFSKENTNLMYVLLLAIPSLTIFSIPYAEAITFFFFSLALFFVIKKKPGPAFVFFFLLAWCRPNTIMLVMSAFFALLIYIIRSKKSTERSLPIVTVAGLSIGLIALFTYYYFSSGNFWIFFEAQKNWGTKFQMPVLPFNDYSGEFSKIDQVLVFIITPVAIIKLVHLFLFEKTEKGNWYFIQLFANIYFLFTIFTVIFFQGGSLHSLHRYILATPLGLIFIVDLCQLFSQQGKILKWVFFGIFLFGFVVLIQLTDPIYFIHLIKNTNGLLFTNIGLILFIGVLSLLFWIPRHNVNWKKIYPYLVICTLLLAAFWDSVLFNIFLSRGWLWA